jgi:hypothetical protein
MQTLYCDPKRLRRPSAGSRGQTAIRGAAMFRQKCRRPHDPDAPERVQCEQIGVAGHDAAGGDGDRKLQELVIFRVPARMPDGSTMIEGRERNKRQATEGMGWQAPNALSNNASHRPPPMAMPIAMFAREFASSVSLRIFAIISPCGDFSKSSCAFCAACRSFHFLIIAFEFSCAVSAARCRSQSLAHCLSLSSSIAGSAAAEDASAASRALSREFHAAIWLTAMRPPIDSTMAPYAFTTATP